MAQNSLTIRREEDRTEMITKKEICEKSMIMKGVNGKLEWIMYIGKWDNEDLFQCSHEWLFDNNGRERIGTSFVERDLVDNRYVVMDRRLHRPVFVWRKKEEQ
ncbi:unnamed protein product [Rotaria socialis]|uniref:Uncharacterized protein n=1 Tax=Rotaria socialis TaxID=392032 RepID=A0A818AHJ6_9BILA|nr:unnamed protein product [Rotaria socialis]CAF3523128.1 unnamed protein product [Rotaria socialis]